MSAKQLKTKPEERRCATREVLAQQPKSKLRLYTNYRCLDVVEIRDVSPFGVGLRLNVVIDDGARVHLRYAHKGVQIEVMGTVVWKKAVKLPEPNPHAAYGCWVGIFLRPNSLDANFALYQALMNGTT
ncbi:MAG: PilZ domain-containing protein [Gammaproteobacteria bacterium]|nr:PilZ domain-containing protein [Gammaproteobacteria bacterium]